MSGTWIAQLTHTNAEVRAQALDELEEIAPPRPPVTSTLIPPTFEDNQVLQKAMKLISDTDEEVRASAIRLVGKVAPTGDEFIIEQLLQVLLNEDSRDSVIAAGKAIECIGTKNADTTGKVLRVVQKLFLESKFEVLPVGIRALGKVSLAGDQSVEDFLLLALQSCQDKQTRQAAVRSLKRVSLGSKQVADALFGALKDESWRGLCTIGFRGCVDVRRLLRVFERDEFAVQVTIMKLLGHVARKGDREVMTLIVRGLESSEVAMRLEAMTAARKVGMRGDPEICDRLLRDVAHRLGAVRSSAVQALGCLAHRDDKRIIQALGLIIDSSQAQSFVDMGRDSLSVQAVEAMVLICRSIDEDSTERENPNEDCLPMNESE